MARKNRGSASVGILKKEMLWQAAVQEAVDGCPEARKLVFDRLFPRLRPVDHPKSFSLTGDTPTAKANSILDAVANGELTIDDGVKLLAALSSVMKVIEVDDLQARIEALEGMK